MTGVGSVRRLSGGVLNDLAEFVAAQSDFIVVLDSDNAIFSSSAVLTHNVWFIVGKSPAKSAAATQCVWTAICLWRCRQQWCVFRFDAGNALLKSLKLLGQLVLLDNPNNRTSSSLARRR